MTGAPGGLSVRAEAITEYLFTVSGWAGEDDPAASAEPAPPSERDFAADLLALSIYRLVELRVDADGDIRVDPVGDRPSPPKPESASPHDREDFEQVVTDILVALEPHLDLPEGPDVDDARNAVMRELQTYFPDEPEGQRTYPLWICDHCGDLAECVIGEECEVCCEGTIRVVECAPIGSEGQRAVLLNEGDVAIDDIEARHVKALLERGDLHEECSDDCPHHTLLAKLRSSSPDPEGQGTAFQTWDQHPPNTEGPRGRSRPAARPAQPRPPLPARQGSPR